MTTRAARWSALLDRAMTRQRLSNRQLATAIGVTVQNVWGWRRGDHFPTIEMAAVMAAELGTSQLLAMNRAARTKRCGICRQPFLDAGRYVKAVYCSDRCRHNAASRRRRGQREVQDQLTARRLHHARETLRLFCRECEPEGLCRDAGCVIQARGDSPLRFVRRLSA